MKNQNVTQRLSWRLTELPAVTGLSLAFWRKVARMGGLPVRKVQGAVIVLDDDLRAYLSGSNKQGKEPTQSCRAEPQTEPQVASATA